MVLKLNPNHQALWRDPQTMQVGLADAAVVFEAISQPQERLIAALYAGVSESQYKAFASQYQVSSNAAASLLERLTPLLVKPEPAAEPRSVGRPKTKGLIAPMSTEQREAAFSEMIRASLLNGREPEAVFDERVRRIIHLNTLDRAGLSILTGLAAAGVGGFISSDTGRVLGRDSGATAYPAGLIGQSRLNAADWILRGSPQRANIRAESKLAAATLETLDAAILVGQQVIIPASYQTWMRRGVAHIAVVFDSQGVWVSPIIRPGIAGCLLCFDMSRRSADRSWPTVATQLFESQLRFDDSASQLFAAAVVVKSLVAHFDGRAEMTGFRFDSASGRISALEIEPHADCECGSATELREKTRRGTLESARTAS